MRNTFFIASGFALLFFILTFATLRDYGTSWDETLHFSRGHAYINYFLTGTKEYPDPRTHRRSFYQLDYQNGDFWFKENGGHPPINGILAALSNYIFYQKLGMLSDIHAHHLFNILVSSVLVFVVVFFAASTFGKFAAVVSFFALVTYPLFWAESHFNVKDPAETAFFSATIWTFYESLRGGKARWLLLSFIFFGLALGVKFNALFIPLIILPYLLIRYRSKLSQPTRSILLIPKLYLATLFLGPIIVATIFIGSWPFLWDSWPQNLFKVIEYYKQVGIGTRYQPDGFFISGFNTFPVQWIIFTTPPVVLFLFLIGLVASWTQRNRRDVSTLLLLWFAVPIIRVSVPDASIYGGVRQILEFFPAMALISGLGAWQMVVWARLLFRRYLRNFAPATLMMQILIASAFIWPIFVLVKMHPSQNVYFNFLVGGLKGAAQKNFPSWGNSYGNAYLQGINWINRNVPENAKVALIQGTETNAPVILFRKDLYLRNSNWSSIEREGEYLMELTFNDTGRAFHYTWEYVDKFLTPLYEYKVDGVPILKIWKNDLSHTKPEYKIAEQPYIGSFQVSEEPGGKLVVEFKEDVVLSRVRLDFEPTDGCVPVNLAYVDTAVDSQNWVREKDLIPFPQVRFKDNLQGNTIIFHFAARKARAVRFWFDNEKSCGLVKPNIQIYTF